MIILQENLDRLEIGTINANATAIGDGLTHGGEPAARFEVEKQNRRS